MGKANTMIFAFGLCACIALSLAMKHVVTVKKHPADSPIVKQVRLIFGNRLEDGPKLAIEKVNGKKRAVLTLRPKRSANGRSLAKLIGMFVWRMKGGEIQFDALDVVLKKNATDDGERVTIIPLHVGRRSHKPGTKTIEGKTKPIVTRPAVPKK